MIWAGVWAVLGFILYVLFLNRYLIHMPDHPLKKWAFLLGIFGFVILLAALGLGLSRTAFAWLAVLVIVLLGAGALLNMRIRRAYRRSAGEAEHTTELLRPTPGILTTRHLLQRKFSVRVEGWNGHRLRVAHLSDLHVGRTSPLDFYRTAWNAIEAAQPDIVVVTGDFANHLSALPRLADVLSLFDAAKTYAVLGNHDFWAGRSGIVDTLAACGIRLLENTGTHLPEMPSVYLSGVEAPWAGDAAIEPVPAGTLHLVLSHTPDNIYTLAAQGASVVFSGHTHAGQGRLPGWGAIIVPSRYGRRFDHGHFCVQGTHLFVSSGLGAVNPPVRLFCAPDIFIIDIFGCGI